MVGFHERHTWIGLAGFALIVMMVGGCATSGSQTDDDSTMAAPPGSEFRDAPSTEVADTTVSNPLGFDFGTIYFGFDKATIRDDARLILDSAGAELRTSEVAIVIEGHCDEVGSDEYNLALGELRAEAVRKYLFNLGVATDQMQVVSYGESQPALAGTGETVWRLNRRVEITSRR